MDPITAVAGVVAAGAAVYSSREQRKEGQRQRDFQKRAQAVQSRISDLEAQRARQRQVREARIRRAQIVSQAEGSGVGETSSAFGATGSLQTQLASNLGFMQTTQAAGDVTTNLFQQAADSRVASQGRIQTAQTIGTVASTAGSIFAPKGQ